MIVLDTHVLVWWAAGERRLSARSRRVIGERLRDGPMTVSTISVFEIATAVRRGRLTLSVPLDQWLSDLRALSELRFEPMSVEIAQRAGAFEATLPGDPADRIILATADVVGARLVTADERLRGTPGVPTVW